MSVPQYRAVMGLLALPLAATVGSTASFAGDQLYAVVSGGAMAATNPFFLPGSDTAGESIFADIAPAYSSKSEVSTFSLRGYARLEQYRRRFSSDEMYSLDADLARKVSERVSLRVGAGFRSSRASSQDVFFGSSVIGGGTAGTLPPSLDVNTFGRRNRSRVFNGSLGADIALGPRDSVAIDLRYADNHYSGVGLFNYGSAVQEVRYSRKLSEKTDIYASANVNEVNYRDRREGDALIVSPVLGIRQQMTSTLELSADAGVSWSNVVEPTGLRAKTVTLAFHGQLCDARERGRLCFNASRMAQPTALGRVRTESRIEALYSRRLSEHGRVQLNAGYGRTAESGAIQILKPTSLVSASAEYSHLVGHRLTLFATTNYGDLFESGVARRANFQLRAGVRYHFGDLQ